MIVDLVPVITRNVAALGPINGFLLGRYWDRGPQRTLYLPRPLLRPGRNELLLLELHGPGPHTIHLTDTPDLGPAEPTSA